MRPYSCGWSISDSGLLLTDRNVGRRADARSQVSLKPIAPWWSMYKRWVGEARESSANTQYSLASTLTNSKVRRLYSLLRLLPSD